MAIIDKHGPASPIMPPRDEWQEPVLAFGMTLSEFKGRRLAAVTPSDERRRRSYEEAGRMRLKPCKTSVPDRTKMLDVQHFGTISGESPRTGTRG
jgi:hypothetical protein